MFKSIKNSSFINLNNKINFTIFIVIFVFISTFINKKLYYDAKEISNYQEVKMLLRTIDYKLSHCSVESKKCIDNIGSYIYALKPFVELAILDKGGQALFEYAKTKPRHKDRLPVKVTGRLDMGKDVYEIFISKKTTPNLFYATVRAMTFSFKDIAEKVYDEGVEKTLQWYFQEKIYLRSKDVVFFMLFAYMLLKMLSIKQLQLTRQINQQNLEIVNLAKNIESAKESEAELKNAIDALRSKEIDILSKMKKYDSIINPPIDLLKYEDIVSLDPESIIFKCRKVTEKLITTLYIQNIGNSEFKTLDIMIKELRNKKLLNKKALNYANTIKAFGNISAHPDISNPFEFTNEDAKMISSALILLIEELNIT